MEDKDAGARIRRYLAERMARNDIDGFSELARRSGVGRDTLQAWMRGRRPAPGAGGKVAAALHETYYDLLRAFDGVTAEDMDPELVVAALEWAIKQVRMGQVPPEIRAQVERARSRASSRPPTHRPA